MIFYHYTLIPKFNPEKEKEKNIFVGETIFLHVWVILYCLFPKTVCYQPWLENVFLDLINSAIIFINPSIHSPPLIHSLPL